ncbi:MAG: hypothetical protein JWO87_3755 [Phycisphaerales bacterium]|nr:hypothetical protein [Phycisphaerales bacterium]MDB5302092.1 hypothetical protein [Phycisphaerales bacterium]
MNSTKKLQWLLGLTAGAAMLAVAAGCQNKNKQPVSADVHGEVFRPAGDQRDIRRFTGTQASNGARADATLHAYHFDGPQLNSLGEERLDLMTRNYESSPPPIVYLDLAASGPETAHRQESVALFLKDRGFKEDQIKLQLGYNPHSTSSAAASFAAEQGPAAPTAPTGPGAPAGPAGYNNGSPGSTSR